MVERIALVKWSTGALITVVSIIVSLIILLVTFSTFCSFTLWAWILIISAIFLIPLAILGTARDGEPLTSASDMKLWRLLNKGEPIRIITNDAEFIIKNYYKTGDNLIKWYPKEYWNSEVKYSNLVEEIQQGHTVLVGGVKLIIV